MNSEEWKEFLDIKETKELIEVLKELAKAEAWDLRKSTSDEFERRKGRIEGIEDAVRKIEGLGGE